jgi:hypothetical protein
MIIIVVLVLLAVVVHYFFWKESVQYVKKYIEEYDLLHEKVKSSGVKLPEEKHLKEYDYVEKYWPKDLFDLVGIDINSGRVYNHRSQIIFVKDNYSAVTDALVYLFVSRKLQQLLGFCEKCSNFWTISPWVIGFPKIISYTIVFPIVSIKKLSNQIDPKI